MITGKLKRDIDRLWTEFWQGGITNPLTVIEQITFLMFARLLDIEETTDEKRVQRTGRAFKRRFAAADQDLRWRNLKQEADLEALLVRVRDRVFPHFKRLAGANAEETQTERTFAGLMKDAQLLIQKPSLLQKAIEMIDALPLTSGDRKGDVYEYLLSKLTTAGINGQFRTPRHIIDLMVAMLDPQPDQTVADPACGTGGFLIRTVEHLLKAHTSPSGLLREESDGEVYETWTGDKLSDADWHHIQTRMFSGFDFDVTMLRLAAMNLMLHGVEDAGIRYQDTLGSGFTESERYDLVFANPPFKGSLDFDDTSKTLLAKVRTRKTELLFVSLILRLLKPGGRAAVIVPDGVLFGSSTAHQTLRKHLMDDNQLEAVISLPSGVFKPYAGVSTGILVFTKGGRTEDIFFFDVRADGYSLDDKREAIVANDLPKALDAWKLWQDKGQWGAWERSDQAFFVPAEEIRDNAYDLSLGRYHEPKYQDEQHEPPKVILARMKELEGEVQIDLIELEGMLGD
jgi:type I restriction enzyme M protein